MGILAFAPTNYNKWGTLTKVFSFRQDKTSLFWNKNFALLQFPECYCNSTNSAFKWLFKENLYSFLNSIWNRSFYSQEVSNLHTLMLLVNVAHIKQRRKQRTFKLKSHQFPVKMSKTTMHWCLIWLKCKSTLTIVITHNCLVDHWDWSYNLVVF